MPKTVYFEEKICKIAAASWFPPSSSRWGLCTWSKKTVVTLTFVTLTYCCSFRRSAFLPLNVLYYFETITEVSHLKCFDFVLPRFHA